jgi:hypothetical protein
LAHEIILLPVRKRVNLKIKIGHCYFQIGPITGRYFRSALSRSKALRPRLGDADRVALGDGGAVLVAQMPFEAVTPFAKPLLRGLYAGPLASPE